MPRRLPKVDAVCVGVGWTGGILAHELTRHGMTVVGLERGGGRSVADFQNDHDELHFGVRNGLFQNTAKETWTLRHDLRERALPLRRLGAWLPGIGLGGAGVHWNGQTWRFHPSDFEYRTYHRERYGADVFPEGFANRDWGVTYDTMERYYDRFEYMAGIAGEAGVIQGKRQKEGNPFEGSRQRQYPVGPMVRSPAGAKFHDAATELGHHPFQGPSANLPQPYVNPDGVARNHCTYCGFCERFGCEVAAKADPTNTVIPLALQTGRFDLREGCEVFRVLHEGGRATGVLYRDGAGRIFEQPADMVLMTSFMFNNVRLLMLSKMGKQYDPRSGDGKLGRNFTYQLNGGSAQGWWDDEDFNVFMGSGANGVSIDDFNADNFDHEGLGFLGGGGINCNSTGNRPILTQTVPPGVPAWGAEWKQAIRKYWRRTTNISAQAESPAYRGHFMDLDPTYTDHNGDPVLRITFDWTPNERKMLAYLGRRIEPIMRAMKPDHMTGGPGTLPAHFDTVPYQSTHVNGGAIMGDDESETVVNTWLQMHDFENVWVIGSSAFPQNAGFNPTGTVGALAYRAADGIVNRYRKSPGKLG